MTMCTPLGSSLSGALRQIGLLLGEGDAKCVVHDCVPGSPAYLSDKIKKGDLIVKVRAVLSHTTSQEKSCAYLLLLQDFRICSDNYYLLDCGYFDAKGH